VPVQVYPMLNDSRITTMLPVKDLDRARRFYEREGWSADGIRKRGEFVGVEVDEVRYRIDL